jgi:hypothetical protein
MGIQYFIVVEWKFHVIQNESCNQQTFTSQTGKSKIIGHDLKSVDTKIFLTYAI